MRWLDGITDSMDMSEQILEKTEDPGGPQFMGWQRVRHDLVNGQQQQQYTRNLQLTSYSRVKNGKRFL